MEDTALDWSDSWRGCVRATRSGSALYTLVSRDDALRRCKERESNISLTIKRIPLALLAIWNRHSTGLSIVKCNSRHHNPYII